jgi:hypothetical protein
VLCGSSRQGRFCRNSTTLRRGCRLPAAKPLLGRQMARHSRVVHDELDGVLPQCVVQGHTLGAAEQRQKRRVGRATAQAQGKGLVYTSIAGLEEEQTVA